MSLLFYCAPVFKITENMLSTIEKQEELCIFAFVFNNLTVNEKH